MYAAELEERSISIDQIFLDPNNPRFWTEKSTKDIPDRKVPDADVQARAFDAIKDHGITELFNSILRNGFLPLDRIVVRELDGHSGSFVVLEGNRRLAALKQLRRQIEQETIDEEHAAPEYLAALKASTDALRVLVYTGHETRNITWILQGIRHISGIRDWAPAQRAKLVADQKDNEDMSFREVGQKFGLTAQAVGRLYRAYKALQQMRQDEEFQGKARNDYFTLFEEAYRNKNVRQWLDWNDEDQCFRNEDNLHQFYAWITPDEDHPDKRRRIHDPRQIKQLGLLVHGNHVDLLHQIDQHELSIEGAYDRANRSVEASDWERAIERAADLVGNIPPTAIEQHAAALLERLDQLLRRVENVKRMARAVLPPE